MPGWFPPGRSFTIMVDDLAQLGKACAKSEMAVIISMVVQSPSLLEVLLTSGGLTALCIATGCRGAACQLGEDEGRD
jgi:hypothetical protein